MSIEKQQAACRIITKINLIILLSTIIIIITNSTSFKYKSSITGKTSNANQENGESTEQGNSKTKKNLGIVVPLKHLINFGEL